jgi:hypothetical protein
MGMTERVLRIDTSCRGPIRHRRKGGANVLPLHFNIDEKDERDAEEEELFQRSGSSYSSMLR